MKQVSFGEDSLPEPAQAHVSAEAKAIFILVCQIEAQEAFIFHWWLWLQFVGKEKRCTLSPLENELDS